MKKAIRNIWQVLDPGEKKRFGALVILDVIINMADILALATLLWIIQFYIHPGKDTSNTFLSGWLAGKNAWLFIALFFVLFGLKNLAAYLVNSAHYRFAGKVALRISGEALSDYQRAGLEQFTGVDSSEHVRRISFQPFDFSLYLLLGIQQVITQLFLVLLAIGAILIFNAKLFLLLFVILLPPVILVFMG
ncbi:MAG TPA: hypothetical protein VLJ68_02635 [Chitinophagaceae bacterium]|nr:hypothetical protein [Chitinophagaceae bacterium]